MLDIEGHLRGLQAIPPQTKPAGLPTAAPSPDWTGLFSRAGLDIAKWTPTAPQWNPDPYAEIQAAWRGFLPEAPELPVRIEAAAYRGQPVKFVPVYPWTRPERMESSGLRTGLQVASYITAD